MPILDTVLTIHEGLIELSSHIQSASAKKMKEESHIGINTYTALYKISAYATVLHRAVLSLNEAGWGQINGILLRTMMECSANCLAIINNEYPEYMAFKYFYHPMLQLYRDMAYPEAKRDEARKKIEQGFDALKDEVIKEKARSYMASDRIDIFWFRPEEAGVSSIINSYGGSEQKFMYGALSMSAHAGHLGMFLYQDDPDKIDINPCKNPKKELFALFTCSRMLLEQLAIRNEYEKLGYDDDYQSLLERILATEREGREILLS